jgi:hypothetical protein
MMTLSIYKIILRVGIIILLTLAAWEGVERTPFIAMHYHKNQFAAYFSATSESAILGWNITNDFNSALLKAYSARFNALCKDRSNLSGSDTMLCEDIEAAQRKQTAMCCFTKSCQDITMDLSCSYKSLFVH